MADFILNFRSFRLEYLLSTDFNIRHDTSLEIDAFLNNRKTPAFDDIRKSRKEIADYLYTNIDPKYLSVLAIGCLHLPTDCEKAYATTIQLLQTMPPEKKASLSQYAQRRVELFLNATEYFIPHIAKKPAQILPRRESPNP